MKVEAKLESMGYKLPAPPARGGIYTPIREFGDNLLYASGFGPAMEGVEPIIGKVGREVTLENIQQFGRTVLEDIPPRDSWRASRAFRSHIAVESAKRCLMESVKLAGGEL